MRGRKPKPAHLKILEGNPGKRKLNKREPKPTPSAPGCPTWLSTEAKAEWRRVVPELDRMGLLGRIDRATLATYCAQWALMVDGLRLVAEHGLVLLVEDQRYESDDGREIVIHVRPTKNPALQTVKDAAAQLRLLAAEFGMTPSARGRMTIPDVDDDDEWERVLGPGPEPARRKGPKDDAG